MAGERLRGDGTVRVVSDGQRFWAVGEAESSGNETMAYAWSSEDGVHWTRTDAFREHAVGDAAADSEGLVVVGSRLDGIDKAAAWFREPGDSGWTVASWKATDVRPFIDDIAGVDYEMPSEDMVELTAVAARDPGWIALGHWADGSESGPELRAFTSRRGDRWTFASHAYFEGDSGYRPRSVAATPERVVSVGETGTSSETPTAAALTSLDGEDWQKTEVKLRPGSLVDVTAWRGGFAAGGWFQTSDDEDSWEVISATVPGFATSSDGTEWKTSFDLSAESTPTDGQDDPTSFVTAIAAASEGLFAVGRSNGRSTAWTSADGTAWTPLDDLPQELSESALVDVAAAGKRLVIAGLAKHRLLTLCTAEVQAG